MATNKVAQSQSRSKSGKAAEAPAAAMLSAIVLRPDQVLLPRAEFESISKQLRDLETEIIGVWACRNDECDGLERMLVPLYAARRNFETAVEMEMGSTGVQS